MGWSQKWDEWQRNSKVREERKGCKWYRVRLEGSKALEIKFYNTGSNVKWSKIYFSGHEREILQLSPIVSVLYLLVGSEIHLSWIWVLWLLNSSVPTVLLYGYIQCKYSTVKKKNCSTGHTAQTGQGLCDTDRTPMIWEARTVCPILYSNMSFEEKNL